MEHFNGPSHHRPLYGDEIRLLKLLPGSFDDPIMCHLEYASLGSVPRYHALSYTWGDATRTALIMLDSVQYPVTTNLEAALRYLRDSERILILWADAICINQMDIQERNLQVAGMRDIYGQANRTIIWLGDYAPHAKESVDLVFDLADRVLDLIMKGGDTDAAVKDTIENHAAEFHSVGHQEIAMCKTPERYLSDPDGPEFILGYSKILFSTLCLCAAKIGEARGGSYGLGSLNDTFWIHDMRRMRNELLAGGITLTQAEQLVTFLGRTAFAFEASDERDKIYAILGLLSSKILPPQLQPNYSLTAEQVFWDYAVYMLEETKYLDILTCCSGSRPGLPSWVPDWKYGFPSEQFHIGRLSHICFLEGNRKMEIDCMILSHITKVSDAAEVAAEFPGHVNLEWGSDDSVVLLPQSRKEFGKLVQAIVNVYVALLSIEIKWFGCPALDAGLTPVKLDGWIAALHIGFDVDKAQWNRYSTRQLYEGLMTHPARIFEAHGPDLDFLSDMGSYCATLKLALRNSMFQDSDGKYGRVRNPQALPKPGDAICYFKGGSHRFLIRQEQGGFRFIGTDLKLHPPISAEAVEAKSIKEWEEFWARNQTQRIILH